MSPFAAIYDRRGAPVPVRDRRRLLRSLGVEPDLLSELRPEDSESRGFCVALGGARPRFGPPSVATPVAACADEDTLQAIGEALGLQGELGSALADACRERGAEIWRRLRVPFALALFEPESRVLWLVADPLGPGSLFYAEVEGAVWVSDRIETLLGLPGGSWRLDRGELARFFSIRPPSEGRTFFEEIREVPRGTAVRFEGGSTEMHRFWSADAIAPDRGRTDPESVSGLLERLRRATAQLAESPERVGVMLSGGLDSTLLACLAAREARGSGGRIGACSWIFERLDRCDERVWIDETVAGGDFEVIQVPGDEHYPLARPEAYCRLAGTPEENPYRELKSALYRKAAAAGRTVLLNGGPADVLQRQTNLFLRDLLLDRRWRAAAGSLARHASEAGWRAAAAALARIAWPAGRRSSRPGESWLTPAARSWAASAGGDRPLRAPGFRDAVAHLGVQARGQTLERAYAELDGVRVVSPYWTLDVVEFMLALPAHQVFRPGTRKWVAREAARGLIPEAIRRRQGPTPLDPLFDLGVFERRRELAAELLGGAGAVWPEFLERDKILAVAPGSKAIEKVLLWRCLAFELWRRRHGWELA